MIHCERCGIEAVAASGSLEYCVVCGLFVCARCWSRTGFCASCGSWLGRHTVVRDDKLLRRVDRRLRESRRDALALASEATSGEADQGVLATELICLELKSASAVAVRSSVLAARMSAQRRKRLARLINRIARHQSESQVAIGRAAAALVDEEPNAPPTRAWADVRDRVQTVRLAHLFIGGLMAAAFAGVVALTYVTYIGVGLPAPVEGVLGGVPESHGASGALGGRRKSPSTLAGPAAAQSSSASARDLEVDFDDQRIGAMTDPRWDSGGPLVRIAAFPTAFDRSVEVGTVDGEDNHTCLSPTEWPVALHSLWIDLFLDEADETVAVITTRAEDAEPLISIRLGSREWSVAGTDGFRVASAGGIDANTWYRFELKSAGEETVVGLAPAAGGPVTELEVPSDGLDDIAAVCLGVSGATDARVHYDNIYLEYERSSG